MALLSLLRHPANRLIAALAAGLVLLALPTAAGARSQRDRGGDQIPGQYIVVYNQSLPAPTGKTDRLERLKGFKARLRFGRVVKGFAASLSATQVAELRRDPEVAFVSPDRRVRALGSVPLTSGDSVPTGVRRIGAGTATTTRPASGVNVAVIDTGVDLSHPELNAVSGKNCAGTGPALDDDGHGTHVAGTIAARNDGSGVVGVAPGTRVFSVKVLGSDGTGSDSQVICGIDWVTATRSDSDPSNDIAVANMSLGGTGSPVGSCSTTTDALHRAICASTAAGVTYVVAAGNDGWDFDYSLAPDTPAAYPEVLTVTAASDSDGAPGATGGPPTCRTGEADDRYASFSNFAQTAAGRAHTIAGPGVCIRSTRNGGGSIVYSGTSMATPHLVGAVALCLNEGGSSGPCAGLSPSRVIAKMRTDAEARTAADPGFGFIGDPLRPAGEKYFGYLSSAGQASAVAPTVLSVSPPDGNDSVATDTAVRVEFSEPMDRSATEAAFSLQPTSGGTAVAGAFSWNGNTMSFQPSSPLEAGTAYTARVSTAARDADGTRLASETAWSFTTASPDSEPTSAAPSATVVETGSLRSGGPSDLDDDDGDLFQVNSTSVGKKRDSAWYARFDAIPNALPTLEVTYSGSNSLSCAQALSIYNWATQQWTELDSRYVGSNETTIKKSPTGNLADYVSGSSGNGDVRVRVFCRLKKKNFFSSGDLLRIEYG